MYQSLTMQLSVLTVFKMTDVRVETYVQILLVLSGVIVGWVQLI